MTGITEKTAAYWLDRAIVFEGEGKARSAELALSRAIKNDDTEHGIDPAKASLPRM